ncbi:exodeoxyribonuclease V, alpha subunit [Acinetobacter courvalinii]|uniref:RecBCD enzyme subunit RecD n=2 Tax=Acinetobacter courvalinii TaxID=280147 RepID=N9Q4J4_9GAMM|nr:exodeoxyribonuclease V, alpha subunit [Acinetobacter courvalinii]KAB0661841.1 exodeoxyribonuclease V subunit alpha [Acinetobacter courvalinii]RSN80717.1 exodeoxyribonuclease V subunit alpha [Acinetobacter baumannii]GGH42571.1 RecBCD enzyme subunit RecD [Acinetobacter courvalinii]
MDKTVYNLVDKRVGKFEDNSVEKHVDDQSEQITWLNMWSQYLTQATFSQSAQSVGAAQILQQLVEASLQGDSCIEVNPLQLEVLGDLAVSSEAATSQVAPCVYDQQGLALYRYWQLEQRLAEQICRLKRQTIQTLQAADYHDLLSDEHQQNALKMVLQQGLSVITGGPGTGKTYTLARIIAALNQMIPDIRIAMAAPTGKAAQRMQEALQNSFNDPKLLASGLISDELRHQNTQTLHRLLGMGNRQIPRFNQKQPLPYDVIVVDEASMLDLNLATALFEAVPDYCRLILLGDANQLASVDVGSVLADLQQVAALAENRVQLQTSRRFSGEAKIGQLARFIQAQQHQTDVDAVLENLERQIVAATALQPVALSKDMSDLIQLEYLPEQHETDISSAQQKLMYGFQGYIDALKLYIKADEPEQYIQQVIQRFDDYRILTAIRHGQLGIEQLNRHAEQWLNQQLRQIAVGDWYIGRPVMMTYNDYQLGISNGDIGICFKHRSQPQQFEVFFPSLNKWIAAHRLPRNMQTAFALTIHKSQGSEFTHTAIVLDASAEKLLSQELIYTAVTRAKKVVSILADSKALLQALTTRTVRRSGLVQKINLLIL